MGRGALLCRRVALFVGLRSGYSGGVLTAGSVSAMQGGVARRSEAGRFLPDKAEKNG